MEKKSHKKCFTFFHILVICNAWWRHVKEVAFGSKKPTPILWNFHKVFTESSIENIGLTLREPKKFFKILKCLWPKKCTSIKAYLFMPPSAWLKTKQKCKECQLTVLNCYSTNSVFWTPFVDSMQIFKNILLLTLFFCFW